LHCAYLVDDTAGTNVQVPNLRVTHETVRKTDVKAMGTEGSVGVLLLELVHVGGVGVADGVAAGVRIRGDTPAVNDDADDVLLDSSSGHGVYV